MHDADRTDQDAFTYEVSDEALEAACGTQVGGVTLIAGSYCFTCILRDDSGGAPLTRTAA
jgi:hypothetical protein